MNIAGRLHFFHIFYHLVMIVYHVHSAFGPQTKFIEEGKFTKVYKDLCIIHIWGSVPSVCPVSIVMTCNDLGKRQKETPIRIDLVTVIFQVVSERLG